jgi:hypothetical protein
MVKALGERRWNSFAYILHRDNSREWLMNSGGAIMQGDPERLTLASARPYLEPVTVQFWEDVITLWD